MEKLGNLCQVMDEEFNEFDTTNTWFQQVELGGFGCVSFLFVQCFYLTNFIITFPNSLFSLRTSISPTHFVLATSPSTTQEW